MILATRRTNTVTPTPTPTPIESASHDRTLLVARLRHWSQANGYVVQCESALRDAGYGALMAEITLSPETIARATATAHSRYRITTESLTARDATRHRRDWLRALSEELYQQAGRADNADMVIVVPPARAEEGAETPISETDALTLYGTPGTALPTPDGEHAEAIEAARKAFVTAILAWATRGSHCETVESALIRIGLRTYLPPRYITVRVPMPAVPELGIPEVTVPMRVPMRRDGQPAWDSIDGRTVSNQLTHQLTRAWSRAEVPSLAELMAAETAVQEMWEEQ